jgi:hypothetical protein
VGISLIDTSAPEGLPEVDIETVARAYGEEVRTRDRLRTKIGLLDMGPWRILLAGYVCHAMNRPDESIRSASYTVPGVEAADFPMSS